MRARFHVLSRGYACVYECFMLICFGLVSACVNEQSQNNPGGDGSEIFRPQPVSANSNFQW